MEFMLRHSQFGLYQGEMEGFGYWHPLSESCELGIFRFKDRDEVETFVEFICSDDTMAREDLEILPFDYVLNRNILVDDIFNEHSKVIYQAAK